jgi:hypothetical protein
VLSEEEEALMKIASQKLETGLVTGLGAALFLLMMVALIFRN